jgi:hypothetical protein
LPSPIQSRPISTTAEIAFPQTPEKPEKKMTQTTDPHHHKSDPDDGPRASAPRARALALRLIGGRRVGSATAGGRPMGRTASD